MNNQYSNNNSKKKKQNDQPNNFLITTTNQSINLSINHMVKTVNGKKNGKQLNEYHIL